MSLSQMKVAPKREEIKETLKSKTKDDQEESSISKIPLSTKESTINVTEQQNFEQKLGAESLLCTSEENQVTHLDIKRDVRESEYNGSFQLNKSKDRDSRLDDTSKIEETGKEKDLIFSSGSQKDSSTIPVSELDRRLEYFAHIWFLHRESIEPAKMLEQDPEEVIMLYESSNSRVEEDFVRLKTAIQLGEVPTWHKRKFAEYIVPREVVPTYIEPSSGEKIISDQSIIQEVEYLIDSFVKGLPG